MRREEQQQEQEQEEEEEEEEEEEDAPRQPQRGKKLQRELREQQRQRDPRLRAKVTLNGRYHAKVSQSNVTHASLLLFLNPPPTTNPGSSSVHIHCTQGKEGESAPTFVACLGVLRCVCLSGRRAVGVWVIP